VLKMASIDKTTDTVLDATSWQPNTFATYSKNDMIILLVGSEEREFLAHGGYLSQHSSFFEAALKKEWVEGQSRIVKLLEEEPYMVAQYLDFTYTKTLPTDSTKDDSRKGEVFGVLTKLFALGERLLDSNLRNAILKEIIRFTTIGKCHHPNKTSIRDIYNCTTATSPARRLMVDLYVYRGLADWLHADMHPEFLLDLGKALMSEALRSTLPCRSRRAAAEDYMM
jgi:hypothetical protein